MWEVEWRKERDEKEKRELANKRKTKEKEQAMYASWGTSSNNYEEDDDDIALTAMEESDCEPDSDSEEKKVNISDLKDKLESFSKKKLSLLMRTLMDTIQEQIRNKNQLLASMTSLKFEYIDLEKLNTELQEKTKLWLMKNQKLESFDLALKTENIKLKVIGKEKACDQPKYEHEVEVRERKQHWYMDSACSRHMTRDKTKFLSLEEGKGGMVAFGGGKKGQIKGVGKIGRSDELSIDKVYHVEGLKHIMLSISQLCDKGNKENKVPSKVYSEVVQEQVQETGPLDTINEDSADSHDNHNGNTEETLEDDQRKLNNSPNAEQHDLVLKDYKYQGSHPVDNILTDLSSGITTRSGLKNHCAFSAFFSMVEPKRISEALQDADWIIAMEEELNQFKRSRV
ncbi:uncharacterized protein [Solanum tuberosum]|uniref:uncharacterized protein n=1 Tax=Solanum tuberosum TaxID=4113 RepID=UPI00073A2852|nr:PREDICTED: uncharacterized protein LOC107057793 [Solanum tuberosum]